MSKHHERIKNDPRWKAARAECLERDGYACVTCGSGDELQADHVLELHDHPDLAFDIDNLQTLCGPCNRAKHNESTTKGAERREWVSPRYPEVLTAIDKARSLTTTPEDPRVF